MYVTDDSGKRILCGHPCEWHEIGQALGLNPSDVRDATWSLDVKRTKWWWSKKRRTEYLQDFNERQEKRKSLRAFVDSRTGFLSYYFCVSCSTNFMIDDKKDNRICPECCSKEVFSVKEMVSRKCPRCGNGIIEEKETGLVC
jgi:DNA-directed RNA polymerase subunit RPC12/RpoP